MKNKTMLKPRLAIAIAGASLLGGMSLTATAFQLDFDNPSLTGRLDTNLSVGALWRTQSSTRELRANEDVLTMSQRGYSTQLNKNDANNNYDTGLASLVGKVTPELAADYEGRYGVFLRGTAFYDAVIMDEGHDGGLLDTLMPADRLEIIGPGGVSQYRYASDSMYANNGVGERFTEQARDDAGRRGRMLDAYVWGDFDLVDRPLTLQVGRQVINWGEALFLQNGVNSANYFDLAALRLPGAEIKEALLPLGSAYFSYGLTFNLTMEGFYQWEWENSEDAPVGTYFSTHDAFPGNGANNVIVDGRLVAASMANSLANPSFFAASEVFAGYTEQTYGSLSNPMDYGYEATQVTINRIADEKAPDDGQFGVAFRYFADQLAGTEFGFYYTRTHAKTPVVAAQLNQYLIDSNVASLERIPAIIDNATYQMVYPEDIDMFGISFSSNIGTMAVSGEVAYRPKQPIINEVGDNLLAGLAGAAPAIALTNSAPTASTLTPHCVRAALGGDCLSSDALLEEGASYYFYDEASSVNASLVGIYTFGPMLGTDGLLALIELGVEHNGDLDSENADGVELHYNSTAAIQDAEARIRTPNDVYKTYLTDYAWGYRAVLRANYNDIFAGVSFQPSLFFSHDVEGNSPIGGNFLEGRRALTLGLNFTYLNNFGVGLQGTAFQGGGYSNKMRDRNNASLSLRYSF